MIRPRSPLFNATALGRRLLAINNKYVKLIKRRLVCAAGREKLAMSEQREGPQ
jgi:hypothetical protein